MAAGSGRHQTRTSAGLRSFGYDAIGQLLQVSHSGGNATFSYDAVGNRVNVSGAAGAGSYTANALNHHRRMGSRGGDPANAGPEGRDERERASQYKSAGGAGSLTYDANGNLASGGGWTFTHNGDSRLVGVSGPATASFGRDARNREVVRTINGTTTFLVYDGWTTGAGGGSGEIPRLRDPRIRGGEMSGSERVNCNLVAEYDASGSLTTRYIHGPRVDEILAKVTASGSTYPLEDALGSTIAVTDSSGAVLERITYTDAFGTPAFRDASGTPLAGTITGTRFLFTGREWLAPLGFYDYRNRTYSPSLGRFIQTDPIRFEAGDVNLYRYVANDPSNSIDPTGTIISQSVIKILRVFLINQCKRKAEQEARKAFPGQDKRQHCYASCAFSRCLGMAPLETFLGGVWDERRYGHDSFREHINDIKANIRGIVGSMTFKSCEDVCKDCPEDEGG